MEVNQSLRDEALELQEFFLGTYAEKTLQAALDSNNENLLEITVSNFGNQRFLIEEAQNEVQDVSN